MYLTVHQPLLISQITLLSFGHRVNPSKYPFSPPLWPLCQTPDLALAHRGFFATSGLISCLGSPDIRSRATSFCPYILGCLILLSIIFSFQQDSLKLGTVVFYLCAILQVLIQCSGVSLGAQ
jgi:hypothetical protein